LKNIGIYIYKNVEHPFIDHKLQALWKAQYHISQLRSNGPQNKILFKKISKNS